MYAYHPHYVDAVVNRIRPNDAHIYLSDANFNVTAVMEAAGTVKERYEYSPYGEVTILNGSGDIDGAAWSVDTNGSDIQNEILFTGRWRDPTTGLQLNRNRWYHPQLGRWTSKDPIGYRGGYNLYGYVGGMPTYYVDPLGLRPGETDDEKRLEVMGNGDPDCLKKVQGLFDVLDDTPYWPIGIDTCVGWCLKFTENNYKSPHPFTATVVFPKYFGPWLGFSHHGLVVIRIGDNIGFLDNGFQGGFDKISFKTHPHIYLPTVDPPSKREDLLEKDYPGKVMQDLADSLQCPIVH